MVIKGNESSHMTSYLLLIVIIQLGSTVLKIQLFFKYCDLALTLQGHPRSKVIRGIESSYMTSYLLVIVTLRLGSTVLKIQLFENVVTLI